MQDTFRLTKKICGYLLCMVAGLAPFQASLAVTSSSVSAATTTAKAKPAPAKPAAVIVTKAAPTKLPGPKATVKALAPAKPVTASSFKSAPKATINGAPQKSAPTANAVPTTAVSQVKTLEQ